MDKIIQALKKYLYFLIGLVLSLSLLWPLFNSAYFNIQDDVQNIRLFEINKCFNDLQIPCRWVPDLGGVYGYPLFNYYAPLPYYIGELFYLVSHSLLFSTKAMFGLSFVLSYIFMFLLGRKLWGDRGGLLSAVFYSFAPYHAVDFYVRGAMGEMWAIAFFPAILWALFKLKEKTNLKTSLLLSVFFGCLILSHNLSAMIFLPIIIAVTALLYYQKRDFKFIKLTIFGLVLGLILSSFYFLPALVEKPLVHLETTIEGYFSYTEHFKGLQKLFVDRYWGYGPSLREIPGSVTDNTFPYQIGIVHWAAWLTVLIGALIFLKKEKKNASWIFLFTAITLGAIFMINPKSAPIWRLLPPLWYLQFPWRFLEIVILFMSLCVGGFFTIFKIKGKISFLLMGLLIILVVALNFSYFRPEKFINETDAELLTGQKWDSQIKRSIFDYLPIYAKAPPAELATSRYQLVTGNGQISNFMENSNNMSFNSSSEKQFIFEWSQYYFPEWRVAIDNMEVPINYQNDLGLITFAVPPGVHQISAHFYNTQIRIIGNALSILGMITLLAILLMPKKGERSG